MSNICNMLELESTLLDKLPVSFLLTQQSVTCLFYLNVFFHLINITNVITFGLAYCCQMTLLLSDLSKPKHSLDAYDKIIILCFNNSDQETDNLQLSRYICKMQYNETRM